MFSKLNEFKNQMEELKNQIAESTLTIVGEIADKTITKFNEIAEEYGPLVWEQVAKFTGSGDLTQAPPIPSDVENAEVTKTEEPIADEIVETSIEEEVTEEALLLTEEEIADKLENISYNKLKKVFSRNQILKIVYIMLRSRQQWLSPKEISDLSIEYKFKVLPGNVRKALSAKGLSMNLVLPQMRAGGRRNAKEYKVTETGRQFIQDQLQLA
jgi:uncharacterized membrane protein